MKKILLLFFVCSMSFNTTKVNALNTNMQYQSTMLSKFIDQAPIDLLELYNEQNFMLGPEWFDKDGNLIPVNLLDVKYIQTTTLINPYNKEEIKTTEKYLTVEEYSNWNPIQTQATCDSGTWCWETTAKRIFMVNRSYPQKMIFVINQWKNMPSVRSFDTIGILYNNYTLTKAWGYQWYNTSSNTDPQRIDYGYLGSNMKISNTGQMGVSISQNIVDNVYSVLQNDIYIEGTEHQGLQVSASYQHAVTNIDLATSKNFNFDAWGMGKVFNWNTSWSNRDNMQGVCFNWSSYLWTC